MGTEVYLGMPPASVVEWIRKHHTKPETHIKFVDGTEGDYLLEGNVDYQYLIGKGLVRQDGGPPEWIKKPQEVDFGSAVTSVGANAFYFCTKIQSVTIPDTVTSIGQDAFVACSSLTSVTIGSGMTSIKANSFAGSQNLAIVTFSGKDKATVQGISNYSWGLPSGCVLHCTDGDITI